MAFMLPPLHWLSSGYTLFMLGSAVAGAPPFAAMLRQLIEVGEEMNQWNAMQARLGMELAEMGYPMITAAFAEAPFDWMSDMFRGLRGAMLDMYRQPDKLKAAMEIFTDFAIQSALMIAQMSGNPRIFIPLHRGAGGFMSNDQFAEFYWPGLKKLILALVDAWYPTEGNRIGAMLARLWELGGDFMRDEAALMDQAGLEIVVRREFGAFEHMRLVVGRKPPGEHLGEGG